MCECVVASFDMWVSEHVIVSMSVSMSINELAHTCVSVCLCVPLSCMSENTLMSV